ncbi:hypothetical protein [Pelagibaculum spongiae]|uniref:hypothetical protein n=1 Tax=Pelagibaculum spongiae TaxID=2080658 RepID=UPI0010578D9E|nr:hypothetical protein [Pelagibaculum spongiae]
MSSEQFLLNGFGNENIGSYEQADNLTKRFLMNHTAASMLNDEFAGIDKGYQAGVFNAERVIAWKSLHAANSASKLIDAGFSGDDQVFLGAFFIDAPRLPELSSLQLSQPTIPNMDMRSTLRQMSIGGSGTEAMTNVQLYGLQHGGNLPQNDDQLTEFSKYSRPATALEALDTVDSILTGVAVASGVGTGIAAGKIYLKNK